MTELVIAVDAVRRGRGGPFVAAAVAFREKAAEPLFHYTDGRGVRRSEYLLRKPTQIRPTLITAIGTNIRKLSCGSGTYFLPKEKEPKPAEHARHVAMFWAVRKLTDRLRHFSAEELRHLPVTLLVSGDTTLVTSHLRSVKQCPCAVEADWRVQAARFVAHNAFPEIR